MPSNAIGHGNSTAALLGSGATFTGTWEKVTPYTTASVSILGSLAVATGTLYFDVSSDEGATFGSIPRSIEDITFDIPHMLLIAEQWLRVRYVNDAVAQTGTFRIQTIYSSGRPMSLAITPGDRITKTSEAGYIRQVGDPNLDRNSGLVSFQESDAAQGHNIAVDNADPYDLISPEGGEYAPSLVSETIRIKAGGNAADTAAGAGARTIEVTFLDDNWNEVTETLTTNGALASLATTSLCRRLQHAEVKTVGTNGKANTGSVVFENTTALAVLGSIPVEEGEMQQAIHTIKAGWTAYLTNVYVSVGEGNSADVRMFVIEDVTKTVAPFNAKRKAWGIDDFKGAQNFPQHKYIIVPEKSDIFMDGKRITGSGSASVTAGFDMTLVKN